MAPASDELEIAAAWRALEGGERSEGWRTIPIAASSPAPVLAGRRFPENQEALLVGFSVRDPPIQQSLPQGRGFEVANVELGEQHRHRRWIALARSPAGRLDLFTMMALDVVGTLSAISGNDDALRLRSFLARVRAWQDFMRADGDGCLVAEAEVGLIGELEVLQELVSLGVSAAAALEAWRGPLDGLHDFVFGTGALEVKTTASHSGFLAKVGCLEQLDDSLTSPLFLAAVRLRIDPGGLTLPERVERLRGCISHDPSAVIHLGTRLLHAGFVAVNATRYTRRFNVSEPIRTVAVTDRFPRLVRSSAPIEIRSAHYELDLDLVRGGDVPLTQALLQLGVSL
jgi:hypothetical protein